jgi:hypothetical protein
MPESRVCRECMGLIVDEAANWAPVCVPPPQVVELTLTLGEEGIPLSPFKTLRFTHALLC